MKSPYRHVRFPTQRNSVHQLYQLQPTIKLGRGNRSSKGESKLTIHISLGNTYILLISNNEQIPIYSVMILPNAPLFGKGSDGLLALPKLGIDGRLGMGVKLSFGVTFGLVTVA